MSTTTKTLQPINKGSFLKTITDNLKGVGSTLKGAGSTILNYTLANAGDIQTATNQRNLANKKMMKYRADEEKKGTKYLRNF